MITPDDLIEKVRSYDPYVKDQLLARACDLAIQAHGSQLRESGDPYYQHPLEVAYILAGMKLDTDSIITALLHDTVEDTNLTLEDIEREFGNEVSKLVDGVTKLTKIEYQPDHIRQAENFRKLLLAMSEDIRVLLVKLADRVHNMRTLKFVKSPEKRMRIAHETMEIYAPLAERIGIQTIKNELQDLAFAELYPDARNSILSRLEYLRKSGKDVISKIVEDLTKTMELAGIKANITGREKTPCSIWQKMERKNVGFEQLSDIMAFRVIVDSVEECYRALGVVHTTYKMVPDNFKDFISTPKDNGYRSLHTVVIGPELERIEVQIRTEEMHEIAEFGVAAHWCYKQDFLNNTEGTQYRWIRELLEILYQASDPQEFLENTKLEMNYDQVFCFTPKGNLIALPKGATPIDFAYAVHSDVGHTCVGAKVNGRIVPLRHHLQNGDQVEIIRSKEQTPSPTWEKFAVTGKALSEIRKFVRAQQRVEYIELGKSMLNKTFKNEGYEVEEQKLENILEIFKKKNLEELYISIGEGRIARQDVINALFPDHNKPLSLKSKFSFASLKNKFKRKVNGKDKENAIPIKGLIPGMAMHFAGCCHPLPGDSIVGIVHSGRGVTIHTADCTMLENFTSTPERWIDVSWEKDGNNETIVGRLKTIISNEPGSLALLTTTIAKENANISNLKIVSRSTDFFEVIVDIEVLGAKQLSDIVSSLRTKQAVHSVERFKL
jgi:GTP pyrophosphokinase